MVSVGPQNTADAYLLSVKRFREIVPQRIADNGVLEIPRTAYRDFAQQLTERGRKPQTVRTYLAGAKAYIEWLREGGVQVPEIAAPKKLPKVVPKEIPPLSQDVLAEYLRATAAVAEPFRTVLRLLPATGMRIGELCRVRAENVDLTPSRLNGDVLVPAQYTFRVPASQAKNKKMREVAVFPSAGPFLARYIIHVRPTLPGAELGAEWLFPGRAGRPVSPSTIEAHVRGIRKALGIPDLVPHTLRHYHGTVCDEHGMSQRQIQEQLGHKSANTTARYIHPTLATRQQEIARVDAQRTKGSP